MSEPENLRVVQKAYENFKTGSVEALLGQMSDDVDWRLPDIEGVPFAGARRGRGAVAEFFSTLADAQARGLAEYYTDVASVKRLPVTRARAAGQG